MKRYRVTRFGFDTRATLLGTKILETWEPRVRELWLQNHDSILQGLIAQYGAAKHEQKLKNFIEVGAEPISVIAFHHSFLRQARDAFVVGAYYPSLTAACALAERVLNHLILALR